jgi:arsenate reductase
MKTLIFACIHNAGRSQMAAAWFNALANPAEARAVSAGTAPGPRVHPEVLTDTLAREAQLLVTMGGGERCPVVAGLQRDDWPLEDPQGKPLARVREIRDEVKQRVQRLIEQCGWTLKPSEPS